jgi:hypothetical protein
MKTLKHIMLCAVLLLGYTATKAQCSIQLVSYNQGAGSYYFWAQTDSTPAGQNPVDWDFGDGNTLTGANGNQYHSYTASGTYIVSATVTGGGCTNTDYDTLVVDVCDYLANSYIHAFTNGNYVQYQLVTAGNITAYNWSLPGATSPNTNNNSNPIVTYPGAGDYQVCVTYFGTNGCTATLCDTFTLDGISQSCDATFNYYSNNLSLDVYGGVVDSLSPWVLLTYDFGDGNVVTSPWGYSSHNYSTYGTYDVCLSSLDTVTGCTDTFCQQVVIAPPAFSYLSGNVYKGANTACAIVYLIAEDTTGYLIMVDSVLTQDSMGLCGGNYTFYNLPTGRPYFVKAALKDTDPDYADYLPTYFGDVLNWSAATPIDLLNPAGAYNINMIAGSNPGGPGFVGGWVSQGAGLVAGPGVFEGRGVGDPIEGIQVNLTDVNDNPVAYAYTDVDGHYQFSNLALGTYKVYGEILSITAVPSTVTLTGNNPSVNNADIVVNSTTAVTGVNDLKDIHIEGIFPNPVADNSTITISLKEAAELTIRVVDITGRVLVNTTVDVNAGTHQLPVSLKGMAAGAYNVSLTNGTDNKVIRLMKAQ